MAYAITWDETAPDGSTTLASDIDVELQNLKVSVRERLEDTYPDWSSATAGPLAPTGIIDADVVANLPATPVFDGARYFATDTEQEYVGVGGAWQVLGTPNATVGPPRVKVSLTSSKSIPATSMTSLNWDQADFESVGTMWDIATPQDIVIPEDGIYLITFNFRYQTAVTSCVLEGNIAVNGTALAGHRGWVVSADIYGSVSLIIDLSASDIITAEMFQTDSGALNVLTFNTNLEAIKLAETP